MAKSSASDRPTTSHDVARLAGVSRSAVSRCYTPGTYVSETTRRKVERAAAKLKYQPNLLARSLATSRSSIVGLAVSDIDNQHYPAVVQLLSEEIAKAGYRLLLFVTHGRKGPDPLLAELLRYRLAGLILASSSRSSSLAEDCQAAGVPVVMMNNIDPLSHINSVAGDNAVGARTIAEFLAAAGHRRCALVTGLAGDSSNDERASAFASRLAELGLPPPMQACGEFTWLGAAAATRKLLGKRHAPDAIFCINDHMALAALEVARAEFGLTPGGEVSIIGFDDLPISSWPNVSLSSFSQPTRELVSHTLRLLRHAMNGGPATGVHVRVPGELIVRTSTRLPPTGLQFAGDKRTWRPATT